MLAEGNCLAIELDSAEVTRLFLRRFRALEPELEAMSLRLPWQQVGSTTGPRRERAWGQLVPPGGGLRSVALMDVSMLYDILSAACGAWGW